MKHPARVLLLGLGLAAWFGPARSTAAAEATSTTEATAGTDAAKSDMDVGDTIAKRPPPRFQKKVVKPLDEERFKADLAAWEGREYPAIEYLGARWLGVDVEFVHACREGLELIYRRDYKAAKRYFDGLGSEYRGTALSPVGQILIWQALMLENFDFRYEVQYQTAYRRARMELEEAMLSPGNEAWEWFIMAGILGIDAIHTMRKEEWTTALNRGYEAMKAVARARELAPDFRDVLLGDGLFNYWVTVISKSSKAIPDLGDRREEGIRQMVTVEQQGVFLSAPATLGLTFTWIEEGRRRDALASALRNHARYPDNVINELTLSRVYMYNRRYADAERTLKHVLEVAPDNMRAHYYFGRLYLRWKKYDEALASLDRYLAFKDVSDIDRAIALYYKGNVYWRLKDWDAAEAAYKQAWKVGRIDRAKRRLERLDEKRAGK